MSLAGLDLYCLMYIHQSRILHVHTSNRTDEFVEICHTATPDTALLTASTTVTGATSRLIRDALGPEALHHYRSSERTFPLRHRGRYYSVSHTTDITVMAVAATPVGVDVERRLSSEAAADLAWALSADELSELAIGDESRLTEIWTAKEASGKALGVGLGAAPSRILTMPVPDTPGYRVSEVPRPGSGLTQVLTYGWWSENHHIRLAWSMPTTPGLRSSEHARQTDSSKMTSGVKEQHSSPMLPTPD